MTRDYVRVWLPALTAECPRLAVAIGESVGRIVQPSTPAYAPGITRNSAAMQCCRSVLPSLPATSEKMK